MGGQKRNSVFADATWDNYFGNFKSQRKFKSQSIDFTFVTNGDESLETLGRLQPTADQIWMARNSWFRRFREFVANNCIEQFNILLAQEEPPLKVSNPQITSSLVCPNSIKIRLEGDSNQVRFAFLGGGHDWGGDDDRLKDYMVEVNGTLQNGLDDGYIFTF